MRSTQMNCPKEISELTELYLLDRLPVGERFEFEQHLLSCSRCLDVLEATEVFLQAVRGALNPIHTNLRPAAAKSVLCAGA